MLLLFLICLLPNLPLLRYLLNAYLLIFQGVDKLFEEEKRQCWRWRYWIWTMRIWRRFSGDEHSNSVAGLMSCSWICCQAGKREEVNRETSNEKV
ncbi:hypothetical protein C8J56DRAFT_966930 [Mycena floridula]|nr:hypothetical protein C8J56DRAFT_966930 [Mycena floridula]